MSISNIHIYDNFLTTIIWVILVVQRILYKKRICICISINQMCNLILTHHPAVFL